MKRRPVILLIAIVVLPMALLAWAGVRLAQHQRWQAEQQIRRLLTGQLSDFDQAISGRFTALAADLQELTSIDGYDTEALREITRSDPRLFQLFVIDPEDVLIHPNPEGPLLQSERDFIVRAAQIINDRQLQRTSESKNPEGLTSGGRLQKQSPVVHQSSGWFDWYWGPGLHLIYWNRRSSGHIVAAALDRSRWIADLIASLPETPVPSDLHKAVSAPLRMRLANSSGETVYQWGPFSAPEAAVPAAEYRLAEPLSAWQLQVFAPLAAMTAAAGSGASFNLIAGLTITGLALTALAIVFYHQYARDMQEAGQRVSFVNQVSHELRTPLTNIRMYAELIEADLAKEPETDAEPQRRIGVIVAETQRLSRLIDNVLAFARQDRHSLTLSPRQCVVDDVIRGVLLRFEPSLRQKGIATETDLQAPRASLVDAGALEQILGNLISNVEKYAAEGKDLTMTSRQDASRTVITVSDSGPGIAPAHQVKAFEPFWRASNELDHAAGTGIGLTIAREMARLHGGDVTLIPSERGATFQVQLSTPSATGESK